MSSTTASSSSLLSKAVKQHLRRLLFRVHPDYFQNTPHKKHVNETSLQRLHQLLTPILSPPYSSPSRTYSSNANVDIVLHTRDITPAVVKTEYKEITMSANLPNHLSFPQNSTISANITKQRESKNRIQMQFNETATSYHLISTFFKLCQKANIEPSKEEFQLLYDLDVSLNNSAVSSMQYDISTSCWWQLPILVGHAYGRDRLGFICVPFDLRYPDFKQYLIEHEMNIRQEVSYRRHRSKSS
ncbi:hypothetical protein BDF19DRAFT_426332 [Syncephalis fuscata]|nr:hypothetical protein BDF19DRAFT_426332 [Syncephalis fuscata]